MQGFGSRQGHRDASAAKFTPFLPRISGRFREKGHGNAPRKRQRRANWVSVTRRLGHGEA